jgi:hypothetical protein
MTQAGEFVERADDAGLAQTRLKQQMKAQHVEGFAQVLFANSVEDGLE